jgi:hypothetical protein
LQHWPVRVRIAGSDGPEISDVSIFVDIGKIVEYPGPRKTIVIRGHPHKEQQKDKPTRVYPESLAGI